MASLHDHLFQYASQLNDQVLQLKLEILNHSHCNCKLIQDYIFSQIDFSGDMFTDDTQSVAGPSSLVYSSPSNFSAAGPSSLVCSSPSNFSVAESFS